MRENQTILSNKIMNTKNQALNSFAQRLPDDNRIIKAVAAYPEVPGRTRMCVNVRRHCASGVDLIGPPVVLFVVYIATHHQSPFGPRKPRYSGRLPQIELNRIDIATIFGSVTWAKRLMHTIWRANVAQGFLPQCDNRPAPKPSCHGTFRRCILAMSIVDNLTRWTFVDGPLSSATCLALGERNRFG